MKANKKLSHTQLRTTFGERMPKDVGDLVVRGTTAVGKVHSADQAQVASHWDTW